MSRTVFWLVGGGAIVIAVALAVAWRGKLTEQAVIDLVTKPAAMTPSSPAAAPPAAPSPPTSPPTSQATVMPSFDVARISPEGRAVIAGRAAPGAKVVLLDGGKEIASGVADARGEWVILAQEPPLTPGQHELRVIQHIDGRAPVTSEQVAICLLYTSPSPRD